LLALVHWHIENKHCTLIINTFYKIYWSISGGFSCRLDTSA